MSIDAGAARTQIDKTFADSVVPTLIEYIGIPNKSPMFDPSGASTATWIAPSSCSPAGPSSTCRRARPSRWCASRTARR
jgi:hypothetical protein